MYIILAILIFGVLIATHEFGHFAAAKLSGVKVTQMGLYLYDANGKLIKKHSENITNVGSSTTVYHSWYDINAEVGVTLTQATTYKYQFFGVFDGEEIRSSVYSFTTKGGSSVTPPKKAAPARAA